MSSKEKMHGSLYTEDIHSYRTGKLKIDRLNCHIQEALATLRPRKSIDWPHIPLFTGMAAKQMICVV
jgi:hypothetical protein